MKKTLLLSILASFSILKSFAADFINPTWSASNLNPGEQAIYTFNYEIVTASPGAIFYAYFPTGFTCSSISTAVVKVNGSNATISSYSYVAGNNNLIHIRLENKDLATSGSQIEVQLEITNPTTSGTYNFGFIRSSDGAGNEIDVWPNPIPQIEIGSLSSTNFILNKISLYPIPSNEYLIIDENKSFKIENIEIYNSIGKLIKKIPYQSKIDTSSLNEGIYFIKILTNTNSVVKKIVIKH